MLDFPRALILAAACACTCAHATPGFEEAEKWRRDFVKTRDSAGTALIGTGGEIPAYGRAVADLVSRSEALFGKLQGHPSDGDLYDCVLAVTAYRDAWSFTRTSLASQNNANAGAQLRFAFNAGDRYRTCANAIEKLENQRKRK